MEGFPGGGFEKLLSVDDPSLAEQLRQLFNIAERFGLDLATTVVPVVTIDASTGVPEAGAGASVGARLAGIANLVSVIGVNNQGEHPIEVSRIQAATAVAGATRGQIRFMTTAMVYDFGGENMGLSLRDPDVRYPGVTGIIGHVAAAQMPVDWNTDYGVPYEVQLGGGGAYANYEGPWIVPPGYRLIIFRTVVAVETMALFHIV